LQLMLDSSSAQIEQQWRPLVSTTGDDEEFEKRYGEGTQPNVIRFLTFDAENPNSILSCLRAARENARTVREIISSEMWLQLNKFFLMADSAAGDGAYLDSQVEFFAEVKNASHLFKGITDATMTHNEGWHFCRLGRELERADKTSRILDVKYFLLLPTAADIGTTFDDIQWAAVLRSASAFEMYRKGYGRIAPNDIVEFLLLDREFPRAVHCCLMAARESAHAISGTPAGIFRNPVEQLLAELCSELAYAQVDDIVAGGMHEYLDRLQTKMNLVGSGIHETFFARRAVPSRRRVKDRKKMAVSPAR